MRTFNGSGYLPKGESDEGLPRAAEGKRGRLRDWQNIENKLDRHDSQPGRSSIAKAL